MRHARVAYAGGVFAAQVEDAEGLRLKLADGRTVLCADVVWLPPVRPRTIVALGLNYADHAAELAFKAPDEPLVFLKGPNALIGHRGVSRRPADGDQMHPECEFTVVIGKTTRRVKARDALDHVAGYTIANDYAIREYLENYYRPNLRVKNRDGCTALGPWIVDRDSLGEIDDLSLRTTVNGETVQQGSTKDMIFDVPFLIEYLSGFMTLEPGDLILTGTPHGVTFVQPGDEVVCAIEGLGALSNTLASDKDHDR